MSENIARGIFFKVKHCVLNKRIARKVVCYGRTSFCIYMPPDFSKLKQHYKEEWGNISTQ